MGSVVVAKEESLREGIPLVQSYSFRALEQSEALALARELVGTLARPLGEVSVRSPQEVHNSLAARQHSEEEVRAQI
jgi:hypothetical protein